MKSNAVLKQEISAKLSSASVRLVEFEKNESMAGDETPALHSKEEFCLDRATD